MPLDTPHFVASLGVSVVWIYLASAALTLRALLARGLALWAALLVAFLLAPLAAPVAVWLGARPAPLGLDPSARGTGFFRPGPQGVWSPSATLGGLFVSLVVLAIGWGVARFGLDISGEPLQGPLTLALLVGGVSAGFVVASATKRVAFLESLTIAAALSVLPVLGGRWTEELFSYGTAPAYYAVLLFAGGLLLMISLLMGGSVGYLLMGDGVFSPSWGYEWRIGQRYLMGKRSNKVVGLITIISVLAVAVGTMAMVVVMSVMNGFSTDLRSKIFGANAHLIVLKYGTDFTEYKDIVGQTRGVSGVRGASPFVLNEVMISSEVNLSGALLKGIDVDSIDEVSVLRSNMTEGDLAFLRSPSRIPVSGGADLKLPDDGSPRSEQDALAEAIALATRGTEAEGKVDAQLPALPGIVIGAEMSRNLKVFVGDALNVVSPVGELGPTGPVPKARAFRVAGIFFSGMYEYDAKFIYIDIAEAQDFFGLNGAVTGIEYRVDDVEATQAVSRGIMAKIGGYPYRTKDWMEMNKNLFSALKLEKIAMFIILTFITLVASFLIAATLIVFVIEKGKEIAILKSMGSSDTSIMKIFVTYGVIVGGIGTAAGMVVGILICYLIQEFGIGLDPDVYYIANLPVHVDPREVAIVAVSAMLLAYLGTLYPALLAARMRPVEGLRYE